MPIDPAVLDSVVNTVVQGVALSLRRQRHLGGLGDSRRLRELVRQRVSIVISEAVDADITKLVSSMSESVAEWAALVKSGAVS